MFIYLNAEALEQAGLHLVRQTGKQDSPHYKLPSGRIVYLGSDGVREMTSAGIMEKPMLPPDVKEEWLTHVTFLERVPYAIHRRLGVYQLASASLTLEYRHKDAVCQVYILSQKIGDAVKLFHLFMAGHITPAVDWEASQVVKPLRSVRELIGQVWQILRFEIHKRFARL